MSLQVSSSPHIRDNSSSQRIMLDVIIALLPTLLASIYLFGERVLFVTFVAVASAIGFEYLSRLVMKRYNSISDLSAAVTGLLLALNLPPTAPVWLPFVGSFVAIVIVKQMFGGIGNNFVNPALAARVVLMLSFPVAMTKWVVAANGHIPFTGSAGGDVDLVATATPLLQLQTGALEANWDTYLQLLIGNKGGCIGEVSILALLAGAVYLLIRKVICIHIPLVYIGTVAIVMLILGNDPMIHILAGGLVLGAVYMATDYVTSPLSMKGKIIYAVGCGLITALIRAYGGMTEGVSFSILLMNILTPHIDRWTNPVPLGGGVVRAKG